MDPLWGNGWIWMAGGVVLGIIEVIAPGFFFLGFAIGALLTGLLLLIGLTPGLPVLLLVFALLSLIAWGLVRRLAGKREGQVKIWDRDINDNP
ncbi:NfeD family protein [Pseudogemmobacter faecipullorum]|uniref:NfeD family protein n=1 Tax=Pseudogemmobacter faecipullorum TaxID=2755041 RepID=A0ABS8CI47_9RHOB|nr:hypothetical protein [Pseudogemmobacter faecipullorum]MCB5408825.1 hypothetical protein [Pseudogemmobacter faecipullorum]